MSGRDTFCESQEPLIIRNALAVLAFVGAALAAQAPTVAPKNDYSRGANWLCRPGRTDACAVDLSATVIAANGSLTYLAITVHPDPSGPRTKTLKGDVMVAGQVAKDWGLHLLDVNAALANLVDIVSSQARSNLARRTP